MAREVSPFTWVRRVVDAVIPKPAVAASVFDPATGSGSGVERFQGTITLPRRD